MTVREWLTSAQGLLNQKGITSATIDCQLILCHIQKCQRDWLISHDNENLTPDAIAQADALLARRSAYEPMAYIVGHREFFNLDLDTDARALVPRGESEILVETALHWLEGKQNSSIVEVGTGSGAIICALAKNAPGHTYIATELDEGALSLAKQNALKYNLDIQFLQGSLCEPLREITRGIDLLVANLPYIPEGLLAVLDPTVKYFEPHLALSGGLDGLDLYRHFIPQTKGLLAKNGCLIVEHEFDQGQAIRGLILHSYPEGIVKTKPDYLGHDRMTVMGHTSVR